MPDKFDRETRSRMMSGIKSKGTKPEMAVRKYLFNNGFRYRLNVSYLPGKPDILLSKYRAAIFIHGCFWHGHNCHYFVWPKSNEEFWQMKIMGNKEKDEMVRSSLHELGYRVCIIWECVTRDMDIFPASMKTLQEWLNSNTAYLELSI